MRIGIVRGAMCALLATALTIPALAQQPAASTPPAWVARSNENAKVLLEVLIRFSPEAASLFGAEGHDEEVADLKPGVQQRERKSTTDAIATLEQRLATEKDPAVKQDLQIMLHAANQHVKEIDLQEKYDIPYINLSRLYFQGLRSLLDDQSSPERRQAALGRLKRYAGVESGYTPLSKLAEDRTRERLNRPGLLGPSKAEVEKDLSTSGFFVDGVGQLFAKYKIDGYQEPYAKLKQQAAEYNEFLKKEILPKARTDFRLPPEEYAFQLEKVGVDIPPAQLASMAHAAFDEIQKQMQAMAPQVAKQAGLQATDYRDVIRRLKKDQIVGDAILPHYQERLKQIEDIIRKQHLLTLPDREARIRLASAAESAATPAPNMHPPRLINNTGQMGEFVLPLNIPAPPGSKEAMQKFDDFTFKAASWTLTAHEARPGHELQFSSIVEKGVSIARGVFAFNSTNVEGWGLYSEYIIYPYMPPDGQLISLQERLMRAARAFLDPELQSDKTTPEEAKKLLMTDVVLSDPMAQQEIERYMFWAPGQATGYFYGYTKLLELRRDTEKTLGPKFSQQKFHDFVLSQGMVPPPLLRSAVIDEFIPENRAAQGH